MARQYEWGQPDSTGRIPIGGDPSQGYYNTTPPAGGEPPMSPSGKSYYSQGDDPREGDKGGNGDPTKKKGGK